MLGALFGDINGAMFEFCGKKIYDFAFFGSGATITDDSLMTLAIADALFKCRKELDNIDKLKDTAIKCMRDVAHKHPNVQWGSRFHKWLFEGGSASDSCGNGAGMRISPVGWIAQSEKQVKELSKALTEISHTHVEAIKGAEAVAMCVYLARIGKSKEYIRKYVAENYYPQVAELKYDLIWSIYQYDEQGSSHLTCQGSIPESIIAFLDSTDFEDAVRKAIQYGGDSDTQACMTGAIAEAYYGIPRFIEVEDKVFEYLDVDLQGIYFAFLTIKQKQLQSH